MRVFVYEHLCAQRATGRHDAQSLHAEGWAMLSAVLADLRLCSGVETVTLLAAAKTIDGCEVHITVPNEAEIGISPNFGSAPGGETPHLQFSDFRTLARMADWSLVIAPEMDGILAKLCAAVEEEGGKLLGPSSKAVKLTTDKLILADHLTSHGIPTPPTSRASSNTPCPLSFPVVLKPRDGAGSQATFLISTKQEWDQCFAIASAEECYSEMIVQPYIAGKTASVAFLIGSSETISLPAAEQRLSDDKRFHYEGGSLPLPANESQRAQRLARQAVRTIPGLRGYVGVDLVLGEEDGRSDVVIEINPRLTTSYVGLRELARFNLAEAMLAVAGGRTPPPLEWWEGPVHWQVNNIR